MAIAAIRSMTGFGDSERDLEAGRLRVEIRTINNRYLNVQLRTPPGLDRHHRRLERSLREHFARGQVTVNIVFDRSGSESLAPPIRVDIERAKAYAEGLRTIQKELGLDGQIDVVTLSRYRGVLEEVDSDTMTRGLGGDLLLDVTDEAARKAVKAREEEGCFLRDDLLSRLDAMETEMEHVERRAPERLIAERNRLREAVGELLDGEGPVDEERIAREIAHLAERWDIHEELVRFRSHVEMFRVALQEGDSGGVGKRLGFITQELLRETNTIGSKGNDAEIARRVVALKEEIERLREQVENIE